MDELVFAVILLDVVMESDDAGLKFVEYLRQECKNHITRIILRTGQPGQAPELEVTQKYDINDYKSKNELTVDKLYMCVTTSLRNYRDLLALEQNRAVIQKNKEGLEKILKATATIFLPHSMKDFSQGVLTQLESLLRLDNSSLLVRYDGLALDQVKNDFRVLAATGKADEHEDIKLRQSIPDDIWPYIKEAIDAKCSQYGPHHYVGYLSHENGCNVLFLRGESLNISEEDKMLLEIFNNNIGIAYENIYLNREIEETQREVILTLGEVTETRSKETGYHVRRVGNYSREIALECGLNLQ